MQDRIGAEKVRQDERPSTKDNTEFTGLFMRVPPGVRFLVAPFRLGFAFLFVRRDQCESILERAVFIRTLVLGE